MTYKRELAKRTGANLDVTLRLYQSQNPEIAGTIARLHTQYGKYALPDAEARKVVDKAMEDKTLTEELYAMREG